MQKDFADGQCCNFLGAKAAVQSQQQVETFNGGGIPVQQRQFFQSEGIHIADPLFDHFGILGDTAIDVVEIFGFAPAEFPTAMQPFEEAMQFSDVVTDRMAADPDLSAIVSHFQGALPPEAIHAFDLVVVDFMQGKVFVPGFECSHLADFGMRVLGDVIQVNIKIMFPDPGLIAVQGLV